MELVHRRQMAGGSRAEVRHESTSLSHQSTINILYLPSNHAMSIYHLFSDRRLPTHNNRPPRVPKRAHNMT